MKFNLTRQQVILLFIPFVAGWIAMIFNDSNGSNFRISSTAINILLNFTLCLIVSYQAYVTVSFLNAINSKSLIFRGITLLIALCIVVYFFYTVYCSFSQPLVSTRSKISGPIKIADMDTFTLVGTFFLYYVIAHFFLINNIVVNQKLKKLDTEQRQNLSALFLKPLKSLVSVSLWIIITLFIISIAADIIRYSVLAK